MTDFQPHSPKQEQAIFSRAKITAVTTGIQWGKTLSGALWLKLLAHEYTDVTDAFLVTAPTYKILIQSTLVEFLKWFGSYGTLNKQDWCFTLKWGSKVYFRTGTEPDSVVGITNVRAIWGDEAGKYSLYFWENLQARASFRDAPIMLTTSPYALNWIYREIVRPSKRGLLPPDTVLIQASSDENPHFPKQEYERQKKRLDPRRFRALYGGLFERMAGLVYDCFDDDENMCDAFQLPGGTRYFAGVDWGHSKPYAMPILAITPDGMRYFIGETYKTGFTITDKKRTAHEKRKLWGIERFLCDPSEPGDIEEFNRDGLTAQGANNDVTHGITRVYTLLKERRLKIFKGTSPHLLDEIETYHYPEPEELGPDDDDKSPKPVKQADHAMDAVRYVIMGTWHISGIKHAPTVAQQVKNKPRETLHDRFERLKKRPQQQTETWS